MDLIRKCQNGTKIYRDGNVAYKYGKDAKKEYEILKDMDHPNIIKVYSYKTTENLGKCLAMEYFEGEYLVIPTDKQLAMLKSAIKYIHSKGYKHNDLMAYNILQDGETIKIIDFGNAGPFELLAKDVEGCKREDLANFKLFEDNNNELKRRLNHGGKSSPGSNTGKSSPGNTRSKRNTNSTSTSRK